MCTFCILLVWEIQNNFLFFVDLLDWILNSNQAGWLSRHKTEECHMGSAARKWQRTLGPLGSQASTSHPLTFVSFGDGGSVSMCQQIDQIGGN